jgi:hypothetical protein
VIHCNSSRLTSNPGAIVKSNGLALDILPRDEIEMARQFAAARATLEAGKPPKEPERTLDFDKENAQSEAIRTLRYLNTETAATYLASIFGQARRTYSEMEYALLASEHREAAVRELERHVADPDLTLTQNYTSTLIELKARLQESKTGRALMRADWIARIQRESAPPYTLHLFDSSGHQGVWLSNREVDSLADLDEKLAQYPAGATFRWQPDGAIGSAEREMRDRVQELLVNHGMTLLQ